NGTFVKEFLYPAKLDSFPGRVTDIAFSNDPGQTFMAVTNSNTERVHIVRRDDGKEVAQFGRPGGNAGEFKGAHMIASDSKGNIFVGEAGNQRVQKFTMGRAP